MQNYLQEHYVALAGSLDREADARLEQEPGVEGKTKKLTRYDAPIYEEHYNEKRNDNKDSDAKVK